MISIGDFVLVPGALAPEKVENLSNDYKGRQRVKVSGKWYMALRVTLVSRDVSNEAISRREP